MSVSESLEAAYSALDEAEVALERLHKTCCEPGRSPRMVELEETLRDARAALGGVDDPESVGPVIETLEDAGAQIGWLQVGCCAPNRVPLYASMLENLMTAQLTINKAVGLGH